MSLYFKKDQPDVLISICELYCERDYVPENDLKGWIEILTSCHPNHPVIAKLKVKLVVARVKLISEIIERMKKGSEDQLLIMKLLHRLLDQASHFSLSPSLSLSITDCIEESYSFFKRFRFLCHYKTYRNNVELLRLLIHYLEKLLAMISSDAAEEGFLMIEVSVSLLEILIESFNVEMANEVKQRTTSQRLELYLIKYDCILYNLTKMVNIHKLLSREILVELKSNCYFLFSQFFFTFCLNKFDLGMTCLFASLNTQPLDMKLFKELPKSQYAKMDRWYHKGAARLSTSVRQLQLLLKKKNKNVIISCVKKSTDELAIALHKLSPSFDSRSSFLALDDTLMSLNPKLLTRKYETIIALVAVCDYTYINEYSEAFSALVWLSLVYKSQLIMVPPFDWLAGLFPELNVSTFSLLTSDSSSLCRYDIEAFLILSVSLFTRDLKTNDLCSLLVDKWLSWPLIILPDHYNTLYDNMRRLHHNNMSISEQLLIQKSISSFLAEFHCCRPYVPHVNQVLTIARHFKDKADLLTSTDNESESIDELIEWSLHYWSVLLNRYMPTETQTGHAPETQGAPQNVMSAEEKDECHLSMGECFVHKNYFPLALSFLELVPTAQSGHLIYQIRKILAEPD
ncbi:PREDICTED: uncharacterized protein LOC109583864 isoform X2 [Amphimedon queenslandica]|uniref:Uncharacterized protein n=1 Tax=Amphimedon queenslandica TaxID=400682 RepID=A0AAN0JDT9_AMPQE|nr:PREDICTED: uncharacterized protein LOC109583864 isoform X2 [Amphimedon queenslandica]|eukprot:XP_019854926.1 PREDICTED: uncharacterized protein LOC109583864 isoform X2 [Amphimedon queenslandica]